MSAPPTVVAVTAARSTTVIKKSLWRGVPIALTVSLASGVTIEAANELVFELHSKACGDESTLLAKAVIDPTGLSAPFVINITGAEMAIPVANSHASRIVFGVLYATYLVNDADEISDDDGGATTDTEIDVLAMLQITLMRHNATPLASPPAPFEPYLPLVYGAQGGTGINNGGRTLTFTASLVLAGDANATLNIGSGGTLGAAAYLSASLGGNTNADAAKVAKYDPAGSLTAYQISALDPLVPESSRLQPDGLLLISPSDGGVMLVSEDVPDDLLDYKFVFPREDQVAIAASRAYVDTTVANAVDTIPLSYNGGAYLDFGSVANGAYADLTANDPSAGVGNAVAIGCPATPAGVMFFAFCSTIGVITVRLFNFSGAPVNPANLLFQFRIFS